MSFTRWLANRYLFGHTVGAITRVADLFRGTKNYFFRLIFKHGNLQVVKNQNKKKIEKCFFFQKSKPPFFLKSAAAAAVIDLEQ
jgi:hypothetical protein